MAEVLITLGIIGVVAAMTLPVLIANKKAHELQAALNKNASVISQAVLMVAQDEGVDPTPATIGDHALKVKLIKHMKVLKDCGSGTELTACVVNTAYEVNKDAKKVYRNYSNTTNIDMSLLDDGQFILADGSIILIENSLEKFEQIFITVDVNGFQKGPNRWGHDLFTFDVTKSGKILPMGAEGTKFEGNTYCSASSSSNRNGISCTYLALSDKDYFKKLPK